jgi:Xaa-Pro aminopeptidase
VSPKYRVTVLETEYTDRRRAICAGFGDLKFDALVVSALVNVRYLAGFTGSNAALVLEPDRKAVLFTDPRYQIQATQETACRVRVVRGPLMPAVSRHLARRRLLHIGFENHRISFEAHQLLEKDLPLSASLKTAGSLIERRRMIKSPAEIELIRRSMLTAGSAPESPKPAWPRKSTTSCGVTAPSSRPLKPLSPRARARPFRTPVPDPSR